jgi:hypothetical protein
MTSKIPREFGFYGDIPSKPKTPLVCEYIIERQSGKICGKEPVKFFKHLRREGVYTGFCEEHKSEYPSDWSAFKPVDREEVVAHEVMDS